MDTPQLPALIDRARDRLTNARTSAEVLEARAAAQAAHHYAKLIGAANEVRADCLSMVKRAELRMADKIDEGQETGEVASADSHGRGIQASVQSPDTRPATFEEIGVDRRRVAEWRELREAGGERLVDAVIQDALEEGRAPTNADIQRAVTSHHRTRFTGETEWYTPVEYVEAVRACLGQIDLDPATSEAAQETVKAVTWLTAKDDGLRHDWAGRVWLNPPYMQPYVTQFVTKLVTEYEESRVTEAILLTHNYTDTAWFHRAAMACAAICFTRGRIKFVSANGEVAAPTQGQAFFYFGTNAARFREIFESYGFIR